MAWRPQVQAMTPNSAAPTAPASKRWKPRSARGTGTRSTGEFELKDVDEDATLVISGVSIETVEIKVNGRSDLGTITVKLKITGLGEVVINKGYYTEKQKFSTGNVGRVTSKEIERQPVRNAISRICRYCSLFIIFIK